MPSTVLLYFFAFTRIPGKEMFVPFVHNGPFLSFRNYHLQKEAKFKIFFVTMNYVCTRTKIIFISMASHLASLWNRGLKKLGNGLIQCQVNSEKTEMPKVVDSSDISLLFQTVYNVTAVLFSYPMLTDFLRHNWGLSFSVVARVYLSVHYSSFCENTCIQIFGPNNTAQSVSLFLVRKSTISFVQKIHRKFQSNGRRSYKRPLLLVCFVFPMQVMW